MKAGASNKSRTKESVEDGYCRPPFNRNQYWNKKVSEVNVTLY